MRVGGKTLKTRLRTLLNQYEVELKFQSCILFPYNTEASVANIIDDLIQQRSGRIDLPIA